MKIHRSRPAILASCVLAAATPCAATAWSQSTPDARAGSVIVETHKRPARPVPEPTQMPQPAVVYVGGNGPRFAPTTKTSTPVRPTAPLKAAATSAKAPVAPAKAMAP